MQATADEVKGEELSLQEGRTGLLRWGSWVVFVVGWTTALLTPQPVSLAKEMLPDEALFSSFKIAHLMCYGLLAVLTAWLPVAFGQRRWLLCFLSAHAFLTEFFQQFVPGRTSSLLDVAIDHLGILIGLVLTRKWWRPEK